MNKKAQSGITARNNTAVFFIDIDTGNNYN